MITGFNTDIEFGGVTYHVQTEDKGLAKPVIMTLVYDRGTILASKRAAYDDLINAGFDEKVLSERLQKQHRIMCAAIKAGRIDDLKKMSAREVATARASVAGQPVVKASTGLSSSRPTSAELPIPRPEFNSSNDVLFEKPEADSILEAVIIQEETYELPADAIEIVPEKPAIELPGASRLSIELLGDENFKGGERRSIGFMVCRGSGRAVVAGAQIMVKVLGSNFRPQIFHTTTDTNGVARVEVQLPTFRAGRAALLVRALSGSDEVELRRPIAHG